jgi:GTPase SAR1 family protein
MFLYLSVAIAVLGGAAYGIFYWNRSSLRSPTTAVPVKFVLLGLDAVGKTSLVKLLKEDTFHANGTAPTMYPNTEDLPMGADCVLKMKDMPGHDVQQTNWEMSLIDMDGVVFMIDASDKDRIALARNHLFKILRSDHIENKPVLVIGNKIDVPGAFTHDQLASALGLSHMLDARVKALAPPSKKETNRINLKRSQESIQASHIQLFMCTLQERAGYEDGFVWIRNCL